MNQVLDLIFGGAYAFRVQGRVGAFTAMTLDDLEKIIKSGAQEPLMSKNFKTVDSFGYQAVLFPACLLRVLKYYHDYIRPSILDGLSKRDRERLVQSNAPAWLNMEGGQQNVSIRVASFFRSHGLNMTR